MNFMVGGLINYMLNVEQTDRWIIRILKVHCAYPDRLPMLLFIEQTILLDKLSYA